MSPIARQILHLAWCYVGVFAVVLAYAATHWNPVTL